MKPLAKKIGGDSSPEYLSHVTSRVSKYFEQFDDADQRRSEFQKNITFVAMRDTFNLNLNHPFTTLCAYGFREESSQAIVNMLINPDLKMKEGDIFHSNH